MPELIFRAMGHGDAVRDLLEGLVWVTGQADYRLLAAFVVITGFLIVMAACAVRGEGIKVIPYIAAAVLFWFCAMVPAASWCRITAPQPYMWWITSPWEPHLWRRPRPASAFG